MTRQSISSGSVAAQVSTDFYPEGGIMSFLACLEIRVSRFFLILLCVGIMAVGCSDKKGEAKTASSKKKTLVLSQKYPAALPSDFEPTRTGTTPTATSGAFAQAGMTDISDNPGFFAVQDLTPGPGVPQDIDQLIRPVLKQLFKDVKLVEDIGEQPPRVDGEVEENKLVYVVRRLLDSLDGDQLHAELHDKKKWPASPRLGLKPQHSRTQVFMAFFKSTGLRGYSLVIKVDFSKQRIEVISYRLGSKYDRLM
jgi:hypothetical protein